MTPSVTWQSTNEPDLTVSFKPMRAWVGKNCKPIRWRHLSRDDAGEADQRQPTGGDVHLQRGGAVPHHRPRHPRHRRPAQRRLRLRQPRQCRLLLPLHGARLRTKGINFVAKIHDNCLVFLSAFHTVSWRDYTVRGQSNVWRFAKYWPPTPSPPGECLPPPPLLWCGVRTNSLGGEGVGSQYFQ